MGTARPIFAKLFLEGREVPFIGATITCTVGQASIAYVDIVPLREIIDIKARTMVQIAVTDPGNEKQGFPWVGAWEGEVFGYSMGKNPASRQMTLNCIDYTSYWDNALIYFFNSQQSLGKGMQSISKVGLDQKDARQAGIKFQSTTHSTSSYFLEIMRPILDQEGKDFLDALVEVYKKMQNINKFYESAEDRLRITDRIRLKSSGQLEALLEASESIEWMNGIIGQQSGYSTLRQTVQKLMSIIFHDYVTIPFPSKVTVGFGDLDKDPIATSSGKIKTIGQFAFKPNMYMLPPPACNIFYPDEYSSFNYTRNFFQEPTRFTYKPEMPTLFSGGADVSLPHRYFPESYENFMTGKPQESLGDGPLQVDSDPGNYGSKDTDAKSSETNQGSKREQQFLTNEEKMKGILLSQDNLVPGATMFRTVMGKESRAKLTDGVARYLFWKKRFETRGLQVSSHTKLSVVPGFSALVLDDQDPEMSMVSYCNSVTHRIYATQGGYTTANLGYARTVAEQDMATDKKGEPPLPPWFDSDIFGANDDDNDPEDGKKFSAAISDFYAGLLGDKGNKTITDLMNKETLLDAVKALHEQYRLTLEKSSSDIPGLINKITSRDYVKLREMFKFIGATSRSKDLNIPFLAFVGDRISGKTGDDYKQIATRVAIIDKYRNKLRKQRGFRG